MRTVQLINVTDSDNRAAQGVGLYTHKQNSNAHLFLEDTLLAKNPAGGSCYGRLTSLGYNLDGDGSCGLHGPGDLSNVDPKLGPLQDSGGPTFTEALLPGSPAIDAGALECPPPMTDQRRVSRPQGTGCDIGAFEFNG